MSTSSIKFKFVLLALLIACIGIFAIGCGGSSDDSGETADQAQQEIQEQKDVAKEQVRKRAQEEIKEQEDVAEAQKAKNAKKEASAAATEAQEQSDVAAAQNAPGAKTDCGDGVQAGPNTSCSFAQNVAKEFKATGQTSIKVYSPTTAETYDMTCGPWADKGTACTGGNNASVYITG